MHFETKGLCYNHYNGTTRGHRLLMWWWSLEETAVCTYDLLCPNAEDKNFNTDRTSFVFNRFCAHPDINTNLLLKRNVHCSCLLQRVNVGAQFQRGAQFKVHGADQVVLCQEQQSLSIYLLRAELLSYIPPTQTKEKMLKSKYDVYKTKLSNSDACSRFINCHESSIKQLRASDLPFSSCGSSHKVFVMCLSASFLVCFAATRKLYFVGHFISMSKIICFQRKHFSKINKFSSHTDINV